MLLNRWTRRFYLSPDEGGGGGGADSGGGTATLDAPPDSGSSSGDYLRTDSAFDKGRIDRSGDEFIDRLKEGADKAQGKQVPGRQQTGVPGSAVAPASAAFSDQHFQYGQRLGMSKEHVAAFGGPQQFEAFLNHVHQQNEAYANQRAQAIAQQQWAQWQAAQQAQNQRQVVPQNQPQGYQPYQLPQLPPGDQYDPGVVKMAEHFNQQMAAMYQQVQQFGGAAQALPQLQQMHQQFQDFQAAQREAAQQQLFTTVDKTLSEMDKELFGDGALTAVPAQQQAMRRQLVNAASIIEAGYQQRGEALPPTKDLLEAAYSWQFGNRKVQQTTQRIAEKSKSLRGQTTAVPGMTRREEAIDPDERAARAIREKMNEFG